VECQDHWDVQDPGEVEDVDPVLAAPYAAAVLDADDVNAAVVQGLGNVGIVGLEVAPDSMANLGRVRSRFADRVNRNDLTLADSGREVVGEGRDPALPGRVCGNEGRPRDEVTPVRLATRVWR